MVVHKGQPWKVSTKTHSNRFSTFIGMRLSRPIHNLTIPITMIISRKCSIAAILTKWALFSINVVTAEKHAVSLSPANHVSVFPEGTRTLNLRIDSLIVAFVSACQQTINNCKIKTYESGLDATETLKSAS